MEWQVQTHQFFDGTGALNAMGLHKRRRGGPTPWYVIVEVLDRLLRANCVVDDFGDLVVIGEVQV
jgi:hypothetical protein